MATTTFSTFGSFESITAEHSALNGMIRVATSNSDVVFFLDGVKAAKLRDDLSRAIVEAAQASAKAKAAEGAQA